AEARTLRLADRLHLRAVGHGAGGGGNRRLRDRLRGLSRQAVRGRRAAGAVRDGDREDARLPLRRVPRRRADARPARHLARLRFAEPLMGRIEFDVAHLVAGGLVLVSLLLLYQDRMFALLRFFAAHAIVLSLAVAWQALIQDKPELYI